MTARKPHTSEAELEVLKVLWQRGPSTVRDVDAELKSQGKNWAYNTILTFLRRLTEKGYVETEKKQAAYVFHARVTQKQLLQQRLQELVEQVCDNASLPLVNALIDGARLSAEDVSRLRELLDEIDPTEPPA